MMHIGSLYLQPLMTVTSCIRLLEYHATSAGGKYLITTLDTLKCVKVLRGWYVKLACLKVMTIDLKV